MSSFATVAVLELVLQSERVPAMEELKREMERARMAAEECRTHSEMFTNEIEFMRHEAIHLRVWARSEFPDQPIPPVLDRTIAVLEGADLDEEYSESDEEEDDEDEEDSGDMRPLITPQWRHANVHWWFSLWTKPAVCPVCHENPLAKDDTWDGPMTSDLPTRCTHWACGGCWRQIASAERRCPVCHDALGEWLTSRAPMDVGA
jgi:RNA polymerase subunit RPABC4/transcription elongation factor Spt4